MDLREAFNARLNEQRQSLLESFAGCQSFDDHQKTVGRLHGIKIAQEIFEELWKSAQQ